MREYRPIPTLVTILVLALLLGACSPSAPDAPPAPGQPAEAPTPAPGEDGDPAPVTLPTQDEPAPTPSPMPPLPEGWRETSNPDLGLAFALPDGWEVLPGGPFALDLRETAGDGWAQVALLDDTTAADWDLSVQPGTGPEVVLDALLAALREDGDFTAPRPVETRAGHPALASEGTYHLLDEQLLVAVVSLPDRIVIVTGHGGERPPDPDREWSRLRPIYERIIWSLTGS
jgi:hypothetical protein